jgi:integrase
MASAPDATFQDVIDALKGDPKALSGRARHLGCSLRRIAVALDRRPEELPAQWSRVRSRVEEIHPAALGWTHRTAANHKSNLRTVLSWYQQLEHVPRRGAQLTPAWERLWSRVHDRRARKWLSSFLKHLSAVGVEPREVGEPQLDTFMAYRAEATRLAYGTAERRAIARAWNTCVEQIWEWPPQRLMLPPDQRYKGPRWPDFPNTLRAEVDAYFASLAPENRLLGRKRRNACTTRTIATRARELRAFAGKAVSLGIPIASLRSLSVLLHPDLVDRVVNAYWDDDGEIPKQYTIDLPWRLHVIARHTGCLSSDELEQLANIRAAAQEHRRAGLTKKNREVLRAVKSTNVWQRVCCLPEQLMGEARRERHVNPLRAAMKAQVAVATAILAVAPVRIGNLARTQLDEHLFRVGGPHGCYWLEYKRHEVKNHVDLEFSFDTEVTALITEYINLHRPVLLRGSDERWLFPGMNCGSKAPHLLSGQIRDTVEKRTGLRVTAHQFRHVAGATILKKFPANYALVAKVLGHKGTATTIRSYIGLDTLEANNIFGALVYDLRHGRMAA